MQKTIVRWGAVAIAWSALSPAFAGADLPRAKVSGFHDAYAASGAFPTTFKSVYIAPVGADTNSRGLKDLGPRDIKTMEDFLGGALKDRLGRNFTLATAPGPGTLVVEAVFTDLQSNRLTIDQVAKRPELDPDRTVSIGRAAIAITLKDGGSDATLATLSDTEDGWPLQHNIETHMIWGTARARPAGSGLKI